MFQFNQAVDALSRKSLLASLMLDERGRVSQVQTTLQIRVRARLAKDQKAVILKQLFRREDSTIMD